MMRTISTSALLLLAAAGLCACGAPDTSQDSASATTPASSEPATPPPYKPVASVVELMRSVITVSAEHYWQSVSVVVDVDGVHENAPANDDEWLDVWSAAIALAESGNLLMMPPRAIDEPEWFRYSTELVDVGLEAARVAQARDFEGVLDLGEQIYNVCVACHRDFVPALPDL